MSAQLYCFKIGAGQITRSILTFLVLCPFFCVAQNYNCFENNVRHYFTNNIHYLRGIAIDSIKVLGTDTTYYPFKTNRSCTTCDNGCWLGGRVIKRGDGTFLFNTILDDTVIINTLAQPGDSWAFYNDSSSDHYMAEVVSMDTMTFIGILDSVKRIRLIAYHLSTINPADPLHNREFYISKNHGFVKIFDLYTFPYHASISDVYLSHIGTGTFTISDYHPPTKQEVYDFNPGDAFLTRGSATWGGGSYNTSGFRTYDSVLAKTIIDPYHTQYTIRQWNESYSTYGTGSGTTYTSHSSSTYNLIADTSVLTTTNMPESEAEFLMDYFYYPDDTTYCVRGKRYTAKLYIWFEGCDQEHSYKTGFERCKYINNTPDLMSWPGCNTESSYLTFSIKNGVNCGPYPGIPNAVSTLETPMGIELFPNPTTGKLTVTASTEISSVAIYDMLGRIVFTGKYDAQHVEVDISSLQNGLYMVRINEYETRKILKL